MTNTAHPPKRSFASVKRRELFHAGVEQLVVHRIDRDPKLPIGKDGAIAYEKIQGAELIKFAARFAETLEQTDHPFLGVWYSHNSAKHPKNDYHATMVVINGSKVDIPGKHILVGQQSIVVNGFVALKAGMTLIKE